LTRAGPNPLPFREGDFNAEYPKSILSCTIRVKTHFPQSHSMEDDLRPRIGTFFVLIGLGLLALFIGSDMAFQANFWYFITSVGCIGLGAYLKIISSREKGPSQRFGAIRRHREKRKKEKEAKKKAKEEQAKKSKPQS